MSFVVPWWWCASVNVVSSTQSFAAAFAEVALKFVFFLCVKVPALVCNQQRIAIVFVDLYIVIFGHVFLILNAASIAWANDVTIAMVLLSGFVASSHKYLIFFPSSPTHGRCGGVVSE